MSISALPVLAGALSLLATDAYSYAPSFDPEIVSLPGNQLCVDLIASQLDSVGQVCATVEEGELVVRIVAAEGYVLSETHVAVGSSLAGIPVAESGMPQLGRFPYKTTYAPTVSEASYRVSLEDLGSEAPEELYIAAHASVIGTGGTEEGAWAGGTRFREEGSPATYFTVPVGE